MNDISNFLNFFCIRRQKRRKTLKVALRPPTLTVTLPHTHQRPAILLFIIEHGIYYSNKQWLSLQGQIIGLGFFNPTWRQI